MTHITIAYEHSEGHLSFGFANFDATPAYEENAVLDYLNEHYAEADSAQALCGVSGILRPLSGGIPEMISAQIDGALMGKWDFKSLRPTSLKRLITLGVKIDNGSGSITEWAEFASASRNWRSLSARGIWHQHDSFVYRDGAWHDAPAEFKELVHTSLAKFQAEQFGKWGDEYTCNCTDAQCVFERYAEAPPSIIAELEELYAVAREFNLDKEAVRRSIKRIVEPPAEEELGIAAG